MAEIVLTTLNAKYAHASFGLRYLLANLGNLSARAQLLEFDINQRPLDVLEGILSHQPRIVGLGVYIWNAEQSLKLVADLKRVRPDVVVVLGGPEVSYETDQQEIVQLADYTITGEGDLAFAELCERVLTARKPLMKVIPAELPEFAKTGSAFGIQRSANAGANPRPTFPSPGTSMQGQGGASAGRLLPTAYPSSTQHSRLSTQDSAFPNPAIHLPYHLYTDTDLAHRVVYVEASRGCPFKCEFCLSSLDVPVRNVPLDAFLPAMQELLDRGLQHFKFVDRTFNLNLNISRAILQFFLERYRPGLFLHFEMIPDRLPEQLRGLIRQFPPAALQFEVGVQTLNEEVSERISRRQDNAKLAENLRFLREETGVHVHADLIIGLPGEDLASFADGFDRLVAMRPQEIQVGILKRLRGTPIVRHDAEWAMVYSPHAPYEVLSTKTMDFATIQELRRFSRYWDLVANSGNFVKSAPLLWKDAKPFGSFLRFTRWIYQKTGQRTHGIALLRLTELLFEFLTQENKLDEREVAVAMHEDHRAAARELPDFVRRLIADDLRAETKRNTTQIRQQRHLRQ